MTDIQARNSSASLQNSVHDPSDTLSVDSTPQSNEAVSNQTTGEKLSGGITTEQQLKSMQTQLYSFLNDSEQSLLIGQNRENSSQGASRDFDGGLINTGCPGSCHGTMPNDATTTEDDAAFARELLIDSTVGMTLVGGLALSGYQVFTNPNPFTVGEFITEVIPGPNLLKQTRNTNGVATALDAPNSSSFKQTGGGSYSGSADKLYDAIRASDKDVSSISNNTGFKPANIQKVKDHVFYNEHLLDRYVDQGIPARVGRFDSTMEQAQAWNRLENGIHNDADITWLKHETAERWYELKYKSGYSEAHDRVDSRWSGYPWEVE